MPKIFRPELEEEQAPEAVKTQSLPKPHDTGALTLESLAATGRESFGKWENTTQTLAEKGGWIPIFGDLANSLNSETLAVKAALLGEGKHGEKLELDERAKQFLGNHLKAQALNYWAQIQLGLLVVPEALIAKAAGSAIKGAVVGTKAVQGSTRLAKAVEVGETAARLGWKAREVSRLAGDVRLVKEGLEELKDQGLNKQTAAKLGAVGLSRLADQRKAPSLTRTALRFGAKTSKTISRLPETQLQGAFGSVSNEAIAPKINQFAKEISLN